MAKDVDLSSKEWTDIVFEGKNKDFGAYKLREESVRRHNRSVIVVFICLIIGLALLILQVSGVFAAGDEADTNAGINQELLAQLAEEEEEEQQEQIKEPEPEPEQIPIEEDVKQQLLTEAVIVDVVEDDKKMKDQEQIKEDEGQISIKNVAIGAEDFTKQDQMKKEVIVVKEEPKVEKKPEPEKVWTAVEQMPSFPGGDGALYSWLSSHLNYPQQAADEGVSGTVVVKFVVGKDGSVSQVSIARGKHPALDKEALRVVRMLPKFIPGKQNGETVKVWYNLPVKFKLQ